MNDGVWLLLAAAVVALTPAHVIAQTGVPHTFQAGQPARATEVNENFDALEDAVDDNAASATANAAAIQENADMIAGLASGDVIILDFSTLPVVITEPGMYVLDRSWTDLNPEGLGGAWFEIAQTTGRVVVDFKGHSLVANTLDGRSGFSTGNHVALLNGNIGTDAYNAGDFLRLENTSISADVGGSIGQYATISNSKVSHLRGTPNIGANSSIKFSTFYGRIERFVIADNTSIYLSEIKISDTAQMVIGNNVRFIENVVTDESCRGGRTVLIEGEQALIKGNIIRYRPECSSGIGIVTAVQVSGVRNLILENIIDLPADGIGLNFLTSGHLYRDNTIVGASNGFDLGSTTQVDGGGNVSF